MNRAIAALIGAAVLGGCATDRVTLLESESGGALAVLSNDGETVIDTPNTRAALTAGGPRTRRIDPNGPAITSLLATLPPEAMRFSIVFPSDESLIPPGQRGVLDRIRAELEGRPGAQIEVAGFTDSDGTDAYNLDLSKKRAESVASQLREFGFEVDAADAVGRGEYEAQAQLGDGKNNESFRRVDVIVR